MTKGSERIYIETHLQAIIQDPYHCKNNVHSVLRAIELLGMLYGLFPVEEE